MEITSEIPREIENLLIDIKFLSGIPPGHKYNISSSSYVNVNSFISKILRTVSNIFYTSENKEGALNFINRTISTAIQLAKKYPQWKLLISQELSLMEETISNLKHVYSNYPKVLAQLATLELKIQPEAFLRSCQAQNVENPELNLNDRLD